MYEFFILGLLTGAKASIKNFETVFTSSPSFLKIMKNLDDFEIKNKNLKLLVTAVPRL